MNSGERTYRNLCRKYRRLPVSAVGRQFGEQHVTIKNLNLHTKDLKAFFVALFVSLKHIEILLH